MNKPMTASEMAKKRWEGTTPAQRKEMLTAIGKLGGRPICACGKCPACIRRAMEMPRKDA